MKLKRCMGCGKNYDTEIYTECPVCSLKKFKTKKKRSRWRQ